MIRYLAILLFLAGCSCPYDQEDFMFSEEYQKFLRPYEEGDTLYFRNNNNDMDTCFVSEIDTSQICNRGPLAVPYHRSIRVIIKYLPKTKHGTGEEVDLIVSVTKEIRSKGRYEYRVRFDYRDFTAYLEHDTIESENSEDEKLLTQVLNIRNVHVLKNKLLLDRMEGDLHIHRIYWTEKYGLTAYEKEKGGLYVLSFENSTIDRKQELLRSRPGRKPGADSSS